MSRPTKVRRVEALPEHDEFRPSDDVDVNDVIYLQVDEFECIRLIDFLGLTQKECADRMQVGRTTVQAIYEHARQVIAEALLTGKILKIEGGVYEFVAKQP